MKGHQEPKTRKRQRQARQAGETAEDIISAENLIKARYREFPPSGVIDHGVTRLFQCRFWDMKGRTRYFITFREWPNMDVPVRGVAYDAQLTCDTSSGGYLWATVKEKTISATEKRIRALWEAAGSVYYE